MNFFEKNEYSLLPTDVSFVSSCKESAQFYYSVEIMFLPVLTELYVCGGLPLVLFTCSEILVMSINCKICPSSNTWFKCRNEKLAKALKLG